jgi:hypothetical protein
MDVERREPLGAALDEQRRGHHPRQPPPVEGVEHRDRKFAHRPVVAIAHRVHRADRRTVGAFVADRPPRDMVVPVDLGEPVHHRLRQHRGGGKEPQIARLGRQFRDPLAISASSSGVIVRRTTAVPSFSALCTSIASIRVTCLSSRSSRGLPVPPR